MSITNPSQQEQSPVASNQNFEAAYEHYRADISRALDEFLETIAKQSSNDGSE